MEPCVCHCCVSSGLRYNADRTIIDSSPDSCSRTTTAQEQWHTQQYHRAEVIGNAAAGQHRALFCQLQETLLNALRAVVGVEAVAAAAGRA